MASKKSSTLIPPDEARCQVEKPNGNTFMTLGGRPGRERCTNVPTVIVIEKTPGRDGQCGSMSMCAGCLAVFRRQVPKANVTITKVTKAKVPSGVITKHTRLRPRTSVYTATDGVGPKDSWDNASGELARFRECELVVLFWRAKGKFKWNRQLLGTPREFLDQHEALMDKERAITYFLRGYGRHTKEWP